MSDNTVLLVDDEESILFALGKDLTKQGYLVDFASSGEEALGKLQSKDYDLTITDLMLKDINGIEILKAVKKQSYFSPVILITGVGQLSSAIEAFRLGAFDYIEKPCDRKELANKVQAAILQSKIDDEMKLDQKKLKELIEDLEIGKIHKKKLEKLVQDAQVRLQTTINRLTQALQHKNIALTEMLSRLEEEKKQIKDRIQANIENTILPILTKIKQKKLIVEDYYIVLLEKAFEEIVSPFGIEVSHLEANLSPREIEICHMVRSGLSSKEISSLLKVSPRTIDTHRANIRKKLKISNEKVNLPTYLKKI